jgi:biotin carboxyl carrier protein
VEVAMVHGERPVVPERVILAPAPGRFRPVEGNGNGIEAVVEEQVIGFVDGVGHSTPIKSPFGGQLIELMAHTGERVREGQPVAWLRVG